VITIKKKKIELGVVPIDAECSGEEKRGKKFCKKKSCGARFSDYRQKKKIELGVVPIDAECHQVGFRRKKF
jgi:hypothetical protein